MRVALYHHLPPGGAMRVVRDFLLRIPDDIHVDVFGLDDVSGSPFPRARTVAPDGVHPHLASLSAGWSSEILGGRLAHSVLAARLASAERIVAESINGGRYDAAYIHPCWLSNAPGLLRLLKLPTVLYLHEVRRATFEPSYRQQPPLTVRGLPGRIVTGVANRALAARDRAGVSTATTLACNSTYTAERVLASYGRCAEVVSPGVDESVFFPRAARGAPEDLYVLSVGGLEPFKNHHVIVEALGRVPSADRPRLALVYERCDPMYRSRLLARAAELKVSVTEHRGIDDDELATLYSDAAATVLAAQLEPLGLTALESIACGTPVLAVREAGYRETVSDGINGILVPRSIDALAAGISDLVDSRPGLLAAHDLPSTILPRWSTRTSVDSQLDLLRRTACG